MILSRSQESEMMGASAKRFSVLRTLVLCSFGLSPSIAAYGQTTEVATSLAASPDAYWEGPEWNVPEGTLYWRTIAGTLPRLGNRHVVLGGSIESTIALPEGTRVRLQFAYGSATPCANQISAPASTIGVTVGSNPTEVITVGALGEGQAAEWEVGLPWKTWSTTWTSDGLPTSIRISTPVENSNTDCGVALDMIRLGTSLPSVTPSSPVIETLIRNTAPSGPTGAYVASPAFAANEAGEMYFGANGQTEHGSAPSLAWSYSIKNDVLQSLSVGAAGVILPRPDGKLFISPSGTFPFYLFDPSSGEYACHITSGVVGGDCGVGDIAIWWDTTNYFRVSPAGDLHWLDDTRYSIFKVDEKLRTLIVVAGDNPTPPGDGDISARLGLGGPAREAFIGGTTTFGFDKFSNLYLYASSWILKVDAATGILTKIADGAPNGAELLCTSMAIDGLNRIYLGCSGKILRFDLRNSEWTELNQASSSVSSPDGTPLAEASFAQLGYLWMDNDGNLYVVDGTDIKVIRGLGAPTIPDTSPPTITPKTIETPSALGWFNTDVHLNWEVVEAESAVSSTAGCESVTIVDDTAGRTFTCTATSGGGTASASYTVRRDTGNPLAFATRSPFANSDGWVNSVVNIRFSGLDGLSGIAGCDPDAAMTTEGAEQTSPPGTCTDPANNVSSPATLAGINIDLTPPEVQAILAQTPNASGWYNQALNIAFTATDLLSGVHVDACSGNQVFIADGQDVGATGTCRDRAGNIATATVAGLKLDRTPPVTTFTVSPAANAAGWHRESVLVEYAGTDALSGSGLAACTPPQLVGTEGRAQSFPGQCSDVAGNTSPPADAKVSIDRQPPRIVVVAPVDGASYITGTTVAASYYCTDGLSGIVACAGSVAAGSTLGTTTAGTYPFSVVAVDAAGHETRLDSTYTVSDGSGGQLTSSSQLSFGNQAVGVPSAPQKITLVNSGTTDLTIAEVTTSGAQATEYSVAGTCVGTLAPGASCDIEVTLTPLAEGSRSASLVISLGTPLAPAATAPATSAKITPLLLAKSSTGGFAPLAATTASAGDVGLAGVGVRPSLSIVDGPVDFGVRTVGQLSSPVPLTLSNNGEVPVDITSLYLDGNHQADFVRLDGCSAVLPVGESCAVRLVFQPSAIGRRSARLNISVAGLPLLSTEVRGISVTSASPPASGPGSANAPALSALDLLGHAPALSSGYYWFDIDGDGTSAAFITFADLETSGGGWMQVRRIPATEEWYPDDDDLGGAVALNSAAATQFNAASAWSHAFGSAVDANTEFLFAAGDYSKWCVIRRGEDLFGGTLDPSALNTVVLDSAGTARVAGERTNVMGRSLSQDPAIGCEGNEAANFQSLLYAEAPSTAPTQFKEHHSGLNVFIRPGSGASRRPLVRAVVTGTESASGWYTSDVRVSWETDGFGSTPVLSPGCADSVVTEDGTNIVLTCEATNAAGSSVSSVTLQRDATPPVATATPSPLPNSAGWNKASVSVAFIGSDATSGVATCSENAVVATEGENQTSASGTCTDAAGNVSAAVTYSPINIDLTAPSVAALLSPAANAAGWNNTAVTVSYAGTDALSGVAADGCDAPAVLTANGTGQSATGTCTDRAGNSASATVAGINIDLTPPTATASISLAANAANWHRTPVTVSFAGTDSLSGSGLAGCSTAAAVSADGAGQARSGTCTDVAGNSSAAASATVNLDQTAPTVTLTTPANGASYVQNAALNASYTCTDALSGIIGCLGTVPSGSGFSTNTLGANSFTVQAADVAGNSASRTVSYTITAPSPFTVSPAALAFGSRLLNTSTALVVTVRNNTAGSLALTSPTLSGTNPNQFTLARTCGTSLAANASCTVTATFRPTSAGAKTAAFAMRIGTTTQSVALSGTGVAVNFTVAPSSIAFGNLARGSTSTKRTITVSNTTALPITLATLSLGGTNANQFVLTRNCGATLAANASCTVDVQFKPTTTGSKRATVTVTPSGATAKTVALTGTGL